MSSIRIPLETINILDQDTFVATLGFVFEGSPWVAAQAWASRPWRSLDHLHAAMCAVVDAAPVEQQLALIRAHPDLAGKAVLADTLGPESSKEQSSAGLDRLTPGEMATFTRLNNAYRETFGFPFVICVRENTKGSILASFEQRLQHERDAEIATALQEVCKIARLRLLDLVATN